MLPVVRGKNCKCGGEIFVLAQNGSEQLLSFFVRKSIPSNQNLYELFLNFTKYSRSQKFARLLKRLHIPAIKQGFFSFFTYVN